MIKILKNDNHVFGFKKLYLLAVGINWSQAHPKVKISESRRAGEPYRCD